MSEKPNPVVFIHGLWIHASSWQPWEEFFQRHGYQTYAPGWPGDQASVEDTRDHPEAVADVGIDDVVTHYAGIIGALAAPPILIGHSFGGMVAQKLLGQDRATAAIAIDAAQIKGVLRAPLSAIRATFPVFRNPANRHRAISLSRQQFRYSFCNAVSAEESEELYERWTIPAPCKPLFEAGLAALTPHSPDEVDTDNPDRGPLLLVMGGRDHTVPEAITKATYAQYRGSPAVTDILAFEDRGHSLTIDAGWPELASACVIWLEKQGL